MGSKVCMNDLCGASLAENFKKGWALRSGEFANLCDKCGIAYEQLAFCDLFHSEDTGWRECTSCGKRVHCGCIASSAFLYLLDNGGVSCISCTRNSGLLQNTSEEKPKEFGMSMENSVGETRSSSVDNQVTNGNFDKIMLKQSNVSTDDNGQRNLHPYENDGVNGYQMKREESLLPSGEIRTSVSTFNEVTAESAHVARFHTYKGNTVNKDIYGSPVQTNLTISLATPSVAEPWSRPILPKVPKPIFAQGFGPNAGTNSQVRVARPPVEGRVKNQLLPRYWPRITEQELQQISGDSKSTIIPLFEKVLSASDAGRIGRLVLPKACAEAYFPPISQPEGLPLKIQDVKGKEWVFQFRFWPNNNSRMYVLEGVTPCIQSMLLQAGDTVTFSRMEPEGKLLMGFRKASTAMKDTHLSAMHSGIFSSEPSFLGINISENLSTMNDHSGLLQSMKGSADFHLNALSRNVNLPTIRDGSWLHMNEKHGGKGRDGSFPPSMQAPERKRSRNIGPKNKRLLFDSQDALELKHTWEELQDMLCPPTSISPSTFTIEDHEFEEYEEPPVLGKGSIFTVRSSGEQEQWAQCDNCSKWRRLPANVLLPPQWTCQNNVWDPNRCSCPAPEELSPRDLEHLLKLAKDFQKRRIAKSHWIEGEQGCPDADAIAGGNAVGDNTSEPSIVATTTKHPRHRPGCSCIVCIQPPSGKGKHKPTCTCNVCMTVKRRFKTLMLRKKKRQSEREAEIAEKNQQLLWRPKEEETEVDSISRRAVQLNAPNTNDSRLCSENGKGQVDLNFHPHREEDSSHANTTGPAPAPTRVSMMSLLKVANLPLEMYLKQNGLTSLICNKPQQQQGSSGSPVGPQSEGGRLDSTPGTRPVVQEERESDDQIRSSSS